MKRIIAMLMMAVIVTGYSEDAAAKERKTRSRDVVSLVQEYKKAEGFDVVSVGSLGMGLVKIIANITADTPEDKAALSILNGLNKVVVVEYGAMDPGCRESFVTEVEALLKNAEIILEAKDEGDIVRIYGTASDDGKKISDLMVFTPEDNTLICLLGSISAEKIGELMTM